MYQPQTSPQMKQFHPQKLPQKRVKPTGHQRKPSSENLELHKEVARLHSALTSTINENRALFKQQLDRGLRIKLYFKNQEKNELIQSLYREIKRNEDMILKFGKEFNEQTKNEMIARLLMKLETMIITQQDMNNQLNTKIINTQKDCHDYIRQVEERFNFYQRTSQQLIELKEQEINQLLKQQKPEISTSFSDIQQLLKEKNQDILKFSEKINSIEQEKKSLLLKMNDQQSVIRNLQNQLIDIMHLKKKIETDIQQQTQTSFGEQPTSTQIGSITDQKLNLLLEDVEEHDKKLEKINQYISTFTQIQEEPESFEKKDSQEGSLIIEESPKDRLLKQIISQIKSIKENEDQQIYIKYKIIFDIVNDYCQSLNGKHIGQVDLYDIEVFIQSLLDAEKPEQFVKVPSQGKIALPMRSQTSPGIIKKTSKGMPLKHLPFEVKKHLQQQIRQPLKAQKYPYIEIKDNKIDEPCVITEFHPTHLEKVRSKSTEEKMQSIQNSTSKFGQIIQELLTLQTQLQKKLETVIVAQQITKLQTLLKMKLGEHRLIEEPIRVTLKQHAQEIPKVPVRKEPSDKLDNYIRQLQEENQILRDNQPSIDQFKKQIQDLENTRQELCRNNLQLQELVSELNDKIQNITRLQSKDYNELQNEFFKLKYNYNVLGEQCKQLQEKYVADTQNLINEINILKQQLEQTQSLIHPIFPVSDRWISSQKQQQPENLEKSSPQMSGSQKVQPELANTKANLDILQSRYDKLNKLLDDFKQKLNIARQEKIDLYNQLSLAQQKSHENSEVLEKKINALLETIKSQEEDIQELKQQNDDKTQDILNDIKEIETLNEQKLKDKKNMDDIREQYENRIQNLIEMIGKLNQTNSALQDNFEKLQSQYKDLLYQQRSLSDTRRSQQIEKEQLRQEIENLKSNIERLQKDLHDNTERYEQRIQNLLQTIERQNQAKQRLIDDYDALKQECDNLQQKQKNQNELKQSQDHEKNRVQQEISQLREKINQLRKNENELLQIKSNYEKLQDDYNSLQQKYIIETKRLMDQINHLKEEFEKQINQCEEAQKIKLNNDILKSKNETLNSECGLLKSQLSKAQKSIENQENQLQDNQKQIDNFYLIEQKYITLRVTCQQQEIQIKDMKKQIEQKDKEIAQKNIELEELQKQKNLNLQPPPLQSNEEQAQRIQNLVQLIGKNNETNKELQGDLEKIKQIKNTLEAEKNKLQEENQNLKNQLSKNLQEANEQQSVVQKLTEMILKLTETKKNQLDEIQRLNKERDNLLEKLNETEKLNEKLQQENDKINNDFAALTQDQTPDQALLQKIQNMNDELTKENCYLKRKYDGDIESLEQKLHKIKDKLQKSVENLQGKIEECNKLKDSLQNSEIQRNTLEDDNKKLQQELEKLRNDSDQLIDLNERSKQILELNKDLLKQNNQLQEKYKQDTNQLQEEIQQLKRKIERLSQFSSSDSDEIAKLHDECNLLTDRLLFAQEDNKKLNEDNKKLQNQIDTLTKQFSEMQEKFQQIFNNNEELKKEIQNQKQYFNLLNQELEQQKVQFTTDLNAAQALQHLTETKLDKSNKECQSLKNQLQDSLKEKNLLKSSLTEEMQKSPLERGTQQEFKLLQQKYQSLDCMNKELQKLLEQKDEELIENNYEMEKIKQEFKTLKDIQYAQEQIIYQLQQKIDILNERIKDLELQIEEKEQTIQQIKYEDEKEVQNLQENLEQAQNDAVYWREQSRKTQDQIDQLMKTLAEKQEDLQQVYNSLAKLDSENQFERSNVKFFQDQCESFRTEIEQLLKELDFEKSKNQDIQIGEPSEEQISQRLAQQKQREIQEIRRILQVIKKLYDQSNQNNNKETQAIDALLNESSQRVQLLDIFFNRVVQAPSQQDDDIFQALEELQRFRQLNEQLKDQIRFSEEQRRQLQIKIAQMNSYIELLEENNGRTQALLDERQQDHQMALEVIQKLKEDKLNNYVKQQQQMQEIKDIIEDQKYSKELLNTLSSLGEIKQNYEQTNNNLKNIQDQLQVKLANNDI